MSKDEVLSDDQVEPDRLGRRALTALRDLLRRRWLGGNRGRARMSPRIDSPPAADEAGALRAGVGRRRWRARRSSAGIAAGAGAASRWRPLGPLLPPC